MMGLRILFTVLAWLVWWGGLVFVIQMDQKARSNDSRSVTPFVLLGLVCGVLVLPAYFWTRYRTFSAALRGLGIALGLGLVAGFIAFVGTLLPS
jgi:hypothetical protein